MTACAPPGGAWTTADALSLSHLAEHYADFDPYCHLNVVDLWAYRVHPVRWFRVGDAVVYRLSDYMTDEPYFTVLGRASAGDAVRALADRIGTPAFTLRCLPQETLDAIAGDAAVVACTEDQDNGDYIFEAQALAELRAPDLQRKHRRLVGAHPGLVVRELDRASAGDRARVYDLFRRWRAQTGAVEWHKEFLALRRALHLPGQQLVCLGVFDGPTLIAYSVNGPEASGYYQGFFGKADRRYPGLSVALEHETAKHMVAGYGSRFLNLQPDSGIPGLRRFKRSLGPDAMLKKYTVDIDLT